jgi:hypothetical protein
LRSSLIFYQEKVKLQETYCTNLRHLLEGLRHQRDVRLAEERRQVEEEEKKQRAKDQMEKEKQLLWHKRSWTAIKKHKKIQVRVEVQSLSYSSHCTLYMPKQWFSLPVDPIQVTLFCHSKAFQIENRGRVDLLPPIHGHKPHVYVQFLYS